MLHGVAVDSVRHLHGTHWEHLHVLRVIDNHSLSCASSLCAASVLFVKKKDGDICWARGKAKQDV